MKRSATSRTGAIVTFSPAASCRQRVDALAEVVAPALGKHVELGCAAHAFHVVAVAGVEAGNLSHPEAARVALELDDRVARLDLAFADDGEVEAVEPALEELESRTRRGPS